MRQNPQKGKYIPFEGPVQTKIFLVNLFKAEVEIILYSDNIILLVCYYFVYNRLQYIILTIFYFIIIFYDNKII